MAGRFTQAVFGAKKYFSDDVIDGLSELKVDERLAAVDKLIPDEITDKLFENVEFAPDDDSDESGENHVEDTPDNERSRFFQTKLAGKLGLTVEDDVSVISRRVEIRFEEHRGRFQVCSEAIKRGEIVAVEDPAVSFPVIRNSEDICNQCCRSLTSRSADSSVLICDACHAVAWCSDPCRSQARRTHHRFECRLRLATLLKEEPPWLGKLFNVFRTITQKSVGFFRTNLESFLNHAPDFGSQGEHICSNYSGLLNLTRHLPSSSHQILELNILCVVFIRMLRRAGYFSKAERNIINVSRSCDERSLSDDEIMIGKLIEVLVPVVNVNTHPVHVQQEDGEQLTVAAAVYPCLASTLNHSCNPNLVRISVRDSILLIAGRDIQPGEELTDMYTVHWTDWDTDSRKEYLQKTFHFECECEACRENWNPLAEDEEMSKEISVRMEQFRQRNLTENTILKIIKKYDM